MTPSKFHNTVGIANGNIETADRYDETGAQYDNLEYHYEKSGPRSRKSSGPTVK